MLISIITINYNDQEGLKKTMTSVFDQTFKSIEYIIIDGGSTDGSKEYIEAHQDSLAYWVSELDTGIYNAMNKGIDKATGEYLLFLNAGDWLYTKDALANFVNKMILNPNMDIYYGNINIVDKTEWIKEYPKDLSFSYFVKHALPHPASLIRKNCFENNYYDESLKIISDWKFFVIGICKYNFTYENVEVVLSSFVLDGISSTNPELVQKEREIVLTKDFPLFMNDYYELIKKDKELKIAQQPSAFWQGLYRVYTKILCK